MPCWGISEQLDAILNDKAILSQELNSPRGATSEVWPNYPAPQLTGGDAKYLAPDKGWMGYFPSFPLGLDAVHDQHQGADYPKKGTSIASLVTAVRGVVSQSAYRYQSYNEVVGPLLTRSLARGMACVDWLTASWRVGGVGYPLDYGFGPGAHYDSTSVGFDPQFYMRPGIYRPQHASTIAGTSGSAAPTQVVNAQDFANR